MAFVPDLSGNLPRSLIGPGPDRDYQLSEYNRTNAGDPNGVLTPLFVGELVLDTTNRALFYAMRSDNASWLPASVDI